MKDVLRQQSIQDLAQLALDAFIPAYREN